MSVPDVGVKSRSRRLTHMEAVIEAIRVEMEADESVFYIGQDAGKFGGSMQGTKGLFERFGASRVIETPISESAMVGVAIGAAMMGRRPIVEVSFGEFLPAAMNQLINQAPNIHYMTGNTSRVPVVVRTRVGDGPYGGHPQDYSVWFAHVPGLKVVMPATPKDALALMRAAIRDDNPVLFFEPMSLSHGRREDVGNDGITVKIGSANLVREGRDVTLVSWGSTVPIAVEAARALQAEGTGADVLDLRSLRPWDQDAVIASVRKTRRLVTVQESWTTCGFGAEVVSAVVEAIQDREPIRALRVGTKPVPVPSGPLRKLALPGVQDVRDAVARVLQP